MNVLLQMDIDLIERLSATIQKFRNDKNTPYSESSLMEAEKEIERIVGRMQSRYDEYEDFEKVICDSYLLKVGKCFN